MSNLIKWFNEHANLASWLILSVGMVAILVFSARDVGLQGMQWFWLVVITVLVAGACVWIISWGDDEIDEESEIGPSRGDT